ncbi:MAG: HEAT repeat domain-containing protein [Planctomycetota bacterium]|nr:HEAT repeat domain-containing protein [Planctomycetota bacterium]
MRTAAVILLLLLAAASRTPDAHAGPDDRPGAEVHKAFNDLYPAAFRAQVNAAIERGKAWLLGSQRANGSWGFFTSHPAYPMGSTGLALLTLLKCGVPADHPAVTKAFAYLRKLPMRRVYSVSVLLMALDAKYAPARDPFAVDRFDRYGNRNTKDPCSETITPEDRAWMEEGVAYLREHQRAEGTWRYPRGDFDLSNTQFALLGLHAASRCGTKVPQRVWLDALRFVLEHQEKTGEPVMYKANEVRGRYRFEWTERAIARGFRYDKDTVRVSASMTTAGLACLVICQSRLWRVRAFTGRLRADTRRGVRDAMAWLQQNFSVTTNTGGSQWWLTYYLYGLERAGILGRFRFLGTRDWYKEGADYLLERQGPGGYWRTGTQWEASCFALLFLKRATARMKAPVITPSGASDGAMPAESAKRPKPKAPRVRPASPTALAIAVARAIKRLEDRDPNVVFQAANTLGWLGHLRAAGPLVRVLKFHADADARTAAAGALGRLKAADAVPALIDALDDGDTLVRYAAEAALLQVTGHRPIGRLRSTEKRNDRVRLQKAWREHWRANEDRIRARLEQPKGT